MRQKKQTLYFTFWAAVVLAGILFVVSREVSVKTEHVEQPLENTFLNK